MFLFDFGFTWIQMQVRCCLRFLLVYFYLKEFTSDLDNYWFIFLLGLVDYYFLLFHAIYSWFNTTRLFLSYNLLLLLLLCWFSKLWFTGNGWILCISFPWDFLFGFFYICLNLTRVRGTISWDSKLDPKSNGFTTRWIQHFNHNKMFCMCVCVQI